MNCSECGNINSLSFSQIFEKKEINNKIIYACNCCICNNCLKDIYKITIDKIIEKEISSNILDEFC